MLRSKIQGKFHTIEGEAVLDDQFGSWLKLEKVKGGTLIFFTIQTLRSEIKGNCHTIEGGAVPDVQYRKIMILPLIRGGLFRLNRTEYFQNFV